MSAFCIALADATKNVLPLTISAKSAKFQIPLDFRRLVLRRILFSSLLVAFLLGSNAAPASASLSGDSDLLAVSSEPSEPERGNAENSAANTYFATEAVAPYRYNGYARATGYWTNIDGPAMYAKVSVYLAKRKDGGWQTVHKNIQTVKSGEKVKVWKECGSRSGPYSWKVIVDVNIFGEGDPDTTRVKTSSLACSN